MVWPLTLLFYGFTNFLVNKEEHFKQLYTKLSHLIILFYSMYI